MSELDRVANILVKRDGMSKNDARCMIESTLSEVLECILEGRGYEAEDLFMEDLGLEPDYLYALII